MSKGMTGKHHTPETRRRMSETRKNMSVQTRHRMSEAQRRRLPPTEETRRKLSDAARNRSEETRRKNSEANKGKKKRPLSAETRRRMSEAHEGKTLSNETRRKIAEANRGKKHSPEVLSRILRVRPSKLELFIKHCLTAHNHNFTHQGHIPGFAKLAGRAHPWDFLLPEKRLAIEVDGRYWHAPRPPRGISWDCSKEAENELYAELLGWRVVRIPETVLRASKPFKLWSKERNGK